MALLCAYFSTTAQWTTSGNEIYNTNTGVVVIKAISPNFGGQKLNVNPVGAGSIVLGESNTGAGGFTSLSLGISAHQNGYSTIQSIKSAGSAHGVLSLNPDGGAVVIGGTTDPGSNYKLTVEGRIGAREVKVTLQNPWPDYVFSPGYRLPDLSKIEQHILTYRHLPGIPSSAEVEKNGGIDLGEMNRKLLEKLEELTLYIIAQQKEIEKLKKEMENKLDKN